MKYLETLDKIIRGSKCMRKINERKEKIQV